MSNIVKNDLFDYENLYIFQDECAFKFSLDSVLLAEYVSKKNKAVKVVDFCTGNAVIPMILHYYGLENIIGIEYQKSIFDLGMKSLEVNNMTDIQLINNDITLLKEFLVSESADIVTCNPPYFRYQEDSLINESPEKAIARHELKCNLDDIVKNATYVLKNDGVFYMVHRAERLIDVIECCLKYKLAIKVLQPITTKINKDATLVLVKAVKNGKNVVKLKPDLCINNVKTFKNIFKEV